MALSDTEYQALEDVVGPDNITREPAILDTYCQVWGHKLLYDSKFSTRPAAVLLPENTEELQAIVRLCNKYKILFKPLSSGFEFVAVSLANERGILLDLKRMDRIIEIDVKNMRAVVEPYVNIWRLQRETMRHGVTIGSIGCGPSAGVIAGSCCHFGAGTTMISTGGLGRSVLGVEWVLPTGEVLTMGSQETGAGWFTADGPGPCLRGVLRGRSGANGGNGIISKVSVKLYPWNGPAEVHFAADTQGKSVGLKRLTEIPRGYRHFVITFPSKQDLFEAMIRVGRAEIAWAVIGTVVVPETEGNDEMWAEIQEIAKTGINVAEIFARSMTIIIGADTPRGLEYKEKYLMKIAGELGGVPFALAPNVERASFAGTMWQIGYVRGAFRPTGDMLSCPAGDGSADLMYNLHNVVKEIFMPYQEKGLHLQLGEHECFLTPFEHTSTGLHEENVFFYDPWNPESLKATREMLQKFEKLEGPVKRFGVPYMGGGAQLESVSHTHEKFGPAYDHYDVWLRQIKNMLDPNGVGDWTAYIPSVFP